MTPDFQSTEPDEMRRIEAWAAENVMGWTPKTELMHGGNIRWWRPSDAYIKRIMKEEGIRITETTTPRYLKVANADYDVLRHVMETWPLLSRPGGVNHMAFNRELHRLWYPRKYGPITEAEEEAVAWYSDSNALYYHVGDYCRAACIVKAEGS